MLPLFYQSVDLVLESGQDIAHLSLDYEIHLMSVLSFLVKVLLVLAAIWFEYHPDPCQEGLLLAAQELNTFVHPLMNHG